MTLDLSYERGVYIIRVRYADYRAQARHWSPYAAYKLLCEVIANGYHNTLESEFKRRLRVHELSTQKAWGIVGYRWRHAQ